MAPTLNITKMEKRRRKVIIKMVKLMVYVHSGSKMVKKRRKVFTFMKRVQDYGLIGSKMVKKIERDTGLMEK